MKYSNSTGPRAFEFSLFCEKYVEKNILSEIHCFCKKNKLKSPKIPTIAYYVKGYLRFSSFILRDSCWNSGVFRLGLPDPFFKQVIISTKCAEHES